MDVTYYGDPGMASGFAAAGVLSYIITLAISVFLIVCMWKIFVKAGKPGWAALVPIYNVYMEFEIVYGNGLKFLLLLIPFANIFFMIKLMFDLAKVFGKGVGFGFLLWFVGIVGYPLLAFGDATYQGPIQK